MDRTVKPALMTTRELALILSLLPKQRAGNSPLEHEQAFQAMWWIAQSRKPWRDLPTQYGKWNSISRRHRRWKAKGVFEEILTKLSVQLDVKENTLPIRVRHIIESLQHLSGRPRRTERKNVKRKGVRSTKRDAKGRYSRA